MVGSQQPPQGVLARNSTEGVGTWAQWGDEALPSTRRQRPGAGVTLSRAELTMARNSHSMQRHMPETSLNHHGDVSVQWAGSPPGQASLASAPLCPNLPTVQSL